MSSFLFDTCFLIDLERELRRGSGKAHAFLRETTAARVCLLWTTAFSIFSPDPDFADPDFAYQTVRGVFQGGEPAFTGAGIKLKSHIQIAVRDARAIIGYFRPQSL